MNISQFSLFHVPNGRKLEDKKEPLSFNYFPFLVDSTSIMKAFFCVCVFVEVKWFLEFLVVLFFKGPFQGNNTRRFKHHKTLEWTNSEWCYMTTLDLLVKLIICSVYSLMEYSNILTVSGSDLIMMNIRRVSYGKEQEAY